VSGVAILGEVAGDVPVVLIAPLFTVAFLTRFAGVSHAIGQGHGTMPWFPRAASWAFLGLGALLASNGLVLGGFLGFVALDALGGLSRRPLKEKAEKVRAPGSRRRLWWTLALLGYLGLVAAFHLLVGLYLPYGTLITWCLLALAFCVAVRVAVAGPKAGEAWLRAPLDHRRHEHREKVVKDPTRARAEAVLLQFRARGDAAPFLEFVREAARAADLPPPEIDALESRIAASFGRAGTGREEDVGAALEEVERFLSLRDARTVEVRP
jgi:hypothetical protein